MIPRAWHACQGADCAADCTFAAEDLALAVGDDGGEAWLCESCHPDPSDAGAETLRDRLERTTIRLPDDWFRLDPRLDDARIAAREAAELLADSLRAISAAAVPMDARGPAPERRRRARAGGRRA